MVVRVQFIRGQGKRKLRKFPFYYQSGKHEGGLVSAASGEASATAQSEFAEMITLSVKYRVETVQRNAKMHERSEKG